MDFFKKRKEVSKRRIPPQKTKVVPIEDYELIKIIRVGLGKGEDFSLGPIPSNEIHYNNAKVLRDFYDMDDQEVLEVTGCWVGGLK